MIIAIDIDNTITYAPDFFSKLTHGLGDVYIVIITFRDDYKDAEKVLKDCGIRYDRLIVLNDPTWGYTGENSMEEWKVNVVYDIGADIFFEDMPEVIRLVKPPTKVFMPCNSFIQQWFDRNLESLES